MQGSECQRDIRQLPPGQNRNRDPLGPLISGQHRNGADNRRASTKYRTCNGGLAQRRRPDSGRRRPRHRPRACTDVQPLDREAFPARGKRRGRPDHAHCGIRAGALASHPGEKCGQILPTRRIPRSAGPVRGLGSIPASLQAGRPRRQSGFFPLHIKRRTRRSIRAQASTITSNPP